MKKSLKLSESEFKNIIRKVISESVSDRANEMYSHINELIDYEYGDVDIDDVIDVLKHILQSHVAKRERGDKYITKDQVFKNWNMNEEDQKVMLRKLAMRSVLGDEAGKYKGWTVEKLLNNDPKKLFYIYTHYEKIGLIDEVLDGLKEKGFPVKKIDKPGVDKDQYREYGQRSNAKFIKNIESKSVEEIQKLITARNINKQRIDPVIKDILNRKKRESIDARRSNKNVEKKSVMQAKNQSKFNK